MDSSMVMNDHVKNEDTETGLLMNEEKRNDVATEADDTAKTEDDDRHSNIDEGFSDGLEWKDGIGTLPGSDLKFCVNEMGVVELITDDNEITNGSEDLLPEEAENRLCATDKISDCRRDTILPVGAFIKSEVDSNTEEGCSGEMEGKLNEIIGSSVESETGADKNILSITSGLTARKSPSRNSDSFQEHNSSLEDYKLGENDTEEDNVEVVTVKSERGTEAPQMICCVCGVQGRLDVFRGRFCSRQCMGKNAAMHRSSKISKIMETKGKRKRSFEENNGASNISLPSVVHENSNRKKNDLKIRIRLSSSPPATDNYDSELGYKKKNTGVGKTSHVHSGKGSARKRRFVWAQYLADENAVMAPPEAFYELTGLNPFPGLNEFQKGMVLEGVDPKHQALICPLAVSEVRGFRIRLHFCGYSDGYDFWTNADSTLIFPCGFCEQTGRELQRPKGYQAQFFQWDLYMRKNKYYRAPDHIFSIAKKEGKSVFTPGQKLEAVDKHNPELMCVATVTDAIGDNVLIHFDGWTNDFDYYCLSSSYLIHPVGWCNKNGRDLTPPEGYDEVPFSWAKYLQDTDSKAAPEDIFISDRHHSFTPGMKLEVVDRRNPILLRVATISQIKGFQILIHFDGWSDMYDYWTDLECPDIHPAGWCKKTNHPLQPPILPEDLVHAPGQTGCPIPGCSGLGHVKGSKFAGHHSEFGCPYSPQNLDKECLNDRLTRARLSTSTTAVESTANLFKDNYEDDPDFLGPTPTKIRNTARNVSPVPQVSTRNNDKRGYSTSPSPPPPQKKMVVSSNEINSLVDSNGKSLYSALHHSVFLSSLNSFPNYDLPLCWDQQAKILPIVKGTSSSDMAKWDSKAVAKFIEDLTGHREYGSVFVEEEIDGEAMLLLTQADISKVLKIKLGPAIKIYNAVLLVKAADHLPV